MEKLISLEDAKKLVAGSTERKKELIGLMNNAIKDQAQQGLRWVHLPITANDIERKWLMDELTLEGFTVSDSSPAVKW